MARVAAVHVLPARCFGCGCVLQEIHHCGACSTCWASLVPMRAPSCGVCGIPVAGAAAGGLRCARCIADPLPLDGVLSAVLYQGFARAALLRAKTAGRREILAPLAAQLQLAVASASLGATNAIVAVPSPWGRRLRRGLDPAHAFALALARATELPLRNDLLRVARGRHVPLKTLRARDRRIAASRGFRPAGDARSLRVLLVDDVLTTGATAAACAEALRRAGALEVRAAVWARTPQPRF